MQTLADLCIQVVASNNLWRARRHTLKVLPEKYANVLLNAAVASRSFPPGRLQLFQHSATRLRVPRAPDDEWIAHIAELRQLEALEFCQEWAVSEKHLPLFQHLAPTLTQLDLGRARLTKATVPLISTLTRLEHLSLQGCLTSRRPPGPRNAPLGPALHPLTRLTFLSLADCTAVTDACVASTLPRLPALRHLDLTATTTSRNAFPYLHPLTRLTHLDLSWTLIEEVPVLPWVEELVLQSCGGLAGGEGGDAGGQLDPLEVPGWRLRLLDLAAATLSRGNARLVAHLISAASNTLEALNLEASSPWPLDIPLLSTFSSSLQRLHLPALDPVTPPHLLALLCPHLTSLAVDSFQASAPATLLAPALVPMLRHLQHLQLPGPTSDEDLGYLATLTALTSLDLRACAGRGLPCSSGAIGGLLPCARAPVAPEHSELAVSRWGGGALDGGLYRLQEDGHRWWVHVLPPPEAIAAMGWSPLSRLKRLRMAGELLAHGMCHGLAVGKVPLTFLELTSPALPDSGLACVASIKTLEELRVTATCLTDYGTQALPRLRSLTSLHIACDLVTREAMLTAARGMRSLQKFSGTHSGTQAAWRPAPVQQGPAVLSVEEEAELLALHDETIRYTHQQLTELRPPAVPAKGAAGGQTLWQQLPGDLRIA